MNDLVPEVSSQQISALTRAALISPLVSERTIGPQSNAKDKHIDISLKSNTNNIGSKSIHTKYTSRKELDLDHNVFSESLAQKNSEKHRKEDLKRIAEERLSIIRQENQKRIQIYQKIIDELEDWKITKVKNDERILEEVEQFIKDTNEINRKRLEYIEKDKENKLKKVFYEALVKYQQKFKAMHEQINAKLLTLVVNKMDISADFNKDLEAVRSNFENLMQKINFRDIGPAEIQQAEQLLNQIDKFYEALCKRCDEYQKANENITENIKNESISKEVITKCSNNTPSPKKVEGNFNVAEQGKIISSKSPSHKEENILETFINGERLGFYNNIMAFYTQKLEAIKPLQSNENMKKYRFSCQKAINIPVNAISAVSPQHLQDKFDKLFSFITGNAKSDNDVSVSDHPLGRDFCLLLLAKKFVSQGDSTVSSNVQAAFPLASVIVSIWQKIPEFGKLFLAYTFKECPYLVPYFIPQFKGQSLDDYYKVLGYRITDGNLEKQDMYLKRQSGIVRLYAAVMITPPREDFHNHPYGIENGWRWLCNILNLEPLPDICATLILEFLQIAGAHMWNLYRKQFYKLLRLIQYQYFYKLSKVDEGGPKARLEVFLGRILKEGRIEEPVGVLPPNFW